MKNIFLGILVAILGISLSLYLFMSSDKFSGPEFVALSLGFAVIGLIVGFAKEVQEFTIAGNGVKLKELRSKAERQVKELERAKAELFRLMLPHVLQGSQQTLNRIDPRIKSFLNIFDQIQTFKIVSELKSEIEDVLHVLLICQYGKLTSLYDVPKTIENSFEELDSPSRLFISLNNEKVDQFMKFNCHYQDSDIAKKDLIEGIQAYAKLYEIKVKLDKITP